ncbi:putative methylated-DNA--protein-cysteine methyltransferase-like [Apostichopus japonicus]|uniref:Methylated-DNA--protein-cysteine methyltransferase n=1 Tax=Stichopus japonicus TaxID=307972 RepID=A0A2G8KS52_STIJA|nr:putative methylated-DNA--protein-cysteine methyltransferase-like [Apostichopus japonicus]
MELQLCGKNVPSNHTNTYFMSSDTFVSKVLHTLAHDIPAGETISYGRLAEKVGNPKACRAVGMAMRINQVPLVVPCHRVVNSDGSLGNYMSGKGVAIKKFLLDHEGAKVET